MNSQNVKVGQRVGREKDDAMIDNVVCCCEVVVVGITGSNGKTNPIPDCDRLNVSKVVSDLIRGKAFGTR